jgi:hypothetical protein
LELADLDEEIDKMEENRARVVADIAAIQRQQDVAR